LGQPARNPSSEEIEQVSCRSGVRTRFGGTRRGQTGLVPALTNSRRAARHSAAVDAVVDLPALQEGDHLAVADHRDDEFPETGVAAIPQGKGAASGFEKPVLVTHGAQGRPTGSRSSAAQNGW
jgi:hypothetical protein